MTNFNERTNTLLYKNIYLSHTLFSKGLMFLLCVRDEWRQGQTAILTHILLLTVAALFPYLGWSCSTGGCWRSQLSVFMLALTLVLLSPTNATAAGTCLYSFINVHLIPRLLPLIYTGASLDWRFDQVSIYNNSIRGSLNKFPDFFRMDTFIDSTHMKH